MRICVVIPSPEYAEQAGARIRYRRLMEPLRRLGHELSLRPLDTFTDPGDITDDAYLLSKCQDAGSLVLAFRAHTHGKLVGIDLFDDYFSQIEDSRLAGPRRWLSQVVGACDFTLCSTPVMQSVARRSVPQLPSHIMNDPCAAFDVDDLGRLLTAKHERLESSRRLSVAWFGMGDNPQFPAGLADLVACGDDLARLGAGGFDTRLRILTNRRAMTPDAIAALRRLPLPWAIDEWSEPAEAALLAESDVAFLPVNAQPFSIAKSLNRAVTALCAGAQVLSVGYPLYAALDAFIYRNPARLLSDLSAGIPMLRPDTVGEFAARLNHVADPEREAIGLITFLSGLASAARSRPRVAITAPPLLGVVYGRDSPAVAHTVARRFGALSIGTPFSHGDLDWDATIRLDDTRPGLAVLVKTRVADLIKASTRARMRFEQLDDAACLRLELDDAVPGAALGRLPFAAAMASTQFLLLAHCARALKQIFDGLRLYLSDSGQAPYPIPDGFAASSEAPA